jgi:serine protease Do
VKTFLASPWKLAPLPIKEILDRTELQYTQHQTGHFEVQFEQEDKSKQSVFVTKEVEYYERADVRKIWSLAKAQKEPPSQEVMLKLLQQSARTKLGAWTVEQAPDGEYMIIYCIKMDATATPDALKSAMEYVSKLTVVMKKELQPKAKAETASDTLNAWLDK